MDIFQKPQEAEIQRFDERPIEFKSNKCYNELNGLLFSPRCIYFYIVLIVISVLVFFYSIFSHFYKLDEKSIIIVETGLCTVVVVDMLVRIYVNGCKNHFSNLLNLLDIILILMNIISIILYIVYHSLIEHLEELTLALLIILRNGSQLLRLIVLIKNQKTVKKNVEEIINFTGVLQEKKFQILHKNTKVNDAISFVDEDNNHVPKKDKSGNLENNFTIKEDDNEIHDYNNSSL